MATKKKVVAKKAVKKKVVAKKVVAKKAVKAVKAVKKVAKKTKVDGVITGKIEKKRDEYVIKLKLRAGTTGELVGKSISTKADPSNR